MHRNNDIIHERNALCNAYFRQNAKLCKLADGHLFFCAKQTKNRMCLQQSTQRKCFSPGESPRPLPQTAADPIAETGGKTVKFVILRFVSLAQDENSGRSCFSSNALSLLPGGSRLFAACFTVCQSCDVIKGYIIKFGKGDHMVEGDFTFTAFPY